jgi:glycyl-tRNA synthetase alpha chain
MLDARGAISVAERTGYIARVRALARQCAERYIEERAAMGHPLLNRPAGRSGHHAGKGRVSAGSRRS